MLAKDILTKNYVKVGLDDTISQMVGKMRKAGKHQALVFDGHKYLGMVGRRFLLTSRIDPNAMKVGNIMKKRSKAKTPFFVPVLRPETTLKEAARLMQTAAVHALPVEEKDKVIGIVQAIDLAKAIAGEYNKVECRELASMNVKTLTYDDEIGKALELMNEKRIEHIPILDKKGNITGIVTATDFIEEYLLWNSYTAMKIPGRATHEKGKMRGCGVRDKVRTNRVPVQQIMTTAVCSTSPNTKISSAISTMAQNNVTSIILTDENKPTGILTLNDIFKDYAK